MFVWRDTSRFERSSPEEVKVGKKTYKVDRGNVTCTKLSASDLEISAVFCLMTL